MKQMTLITAALMLAISISAQAGTDSKDMKEIAPVVAPTTDSAFYVAAYGGVNFSDSYGNKHEVLSAGGANLDISPTHNHVGLGGVGGIKVGYQFDSYEITEGFRLQPAVEGEAFYIGGESEQNVLFGLDHEKYSYNSADVFANGIVRFKIDGSPVTPYVGVGVGFQYLTVHGEGNLPLLGAKVTGFNDECIDFAAQGIAGLDFKICNHWTLFTEYKFVDAIGTDLTLPLAILPGVTYRFKPDQIAQQLATAGVKYDF